MNYFDERRRYICSIQKLQGQLGLTNKKMAEKLGLSERTYERFIAGDPIQREFDLIMRVYEISGQMMYSMTGAKVPREVENSQLYSQLDARGQAAVDAVVRYEYRLQFGVKSR